MKNNLSYWEQQCSIDLFKTWCHRPTGWKTEIINILTHDQPKSVLDVGCGTAHMGELLKNASPLTGYVGVEYTPKFVEHNNVSGYKCVQGSVESLPFEDGSFDSVLCLDVLNYSIDYNIALSELARVAKNKVIMSFWKKWGTGEILKSRSSPELLEHHIDLNKFINSLKNFNLSVTGVINEGTKRNGPRVIICEKQRSKK